VAVDVEAAVGALVLVQQRGGVDEREQLLMVTAVPHRMRREGQQFGVGDHDRQRFEQPLRVAMQREHAVALQAGEQPIQRGRSALRGVDRSGLRRVFVDAEHDHPVRQLRVDVGRRRGQHERDRTCNRVPRGTQPPGGVLAG
jgi:hypothetical protein